MKKLFRNRAVANYICLYLISIEKKYDKFVKTLFLPILLLRSFVVNKNKIKLQQPGITAKVRNNTRYQGLDRLLVAFVTFFKNSSQYYSNLIIEQNQNVFLNVVKIYRC